MGVVFVKFTDLSTLFNKIFVYFTEKMQFLFSQKAETRLVAFKHLLFFSILHKSRYTGCLKNGAQSPKGLKDGEGKSQYKL
jgi:hypothetical protein